MRTLLVCSVTAAVLTWCFFGAYAEDIALADRHSASRAVLDAIRPLDELLRDLSDESKSTRYTANQQLLTVASILHDAVMRERFHSNAGKLLMYEPLRASPDDLTVAKERITVWRRQVQELTPQIIEYLAETEPSGWTPIVDILLLVDPSGAPLLQEKERLLKDDSRRLLIYSKMLSFRGITWARDRSVLAPFIKELQSQDQATRDRWNEVWKEFHGKEFDSQTATLAVMSLQTAWLISRTDRVQVELPQLAALLGEDQFLMLRKASLLVIVNLGEEALPLRQTVLLQFRDQDAVIRLLAAQAIVSMSPATADVSALEKAAKLSGKELSWFRESSATAKTEAAGA